jgi:pyridoxal 5'-phosphate synthase pdxS subunit
LKELNNSGLQKLAEKYSQSYVKCLDLSGKIDDSTLVFGEYEYGTIKKEIFEILKEIREMQRLCVVNFAAGGIATPADAAIMMQLGSDGVFVGSGIFKSENPKKRAKAIVEAVAHYDDPGVIVEVSKDLGDAMTGIEIGDIPKEQMLQERGW